MRSKITYLVSQIKNRRGVNTNKKMLVFLFFLCISCTFWFLNALQNEYTAEIAYPVKYTNNPSGKILVNQLPNEFKLSVKSHGYTLLRNIFNKKNHPINIDIDNISKGKLSNKFFILTKKSKREISAQLLKDLEIIEIIPDTLFFEFSDIMGKKVPIKSNLNLSFAKQFYQSGKLEIIPDSVFVSGAKAILDTLKNVETEKLDIENLQKSINENIKLKNNTDLAFTDEKINIKLPVEKYTETSITIPIEIKNMPREVQVLTFPKEVRVNFLISISKYKKLKPYHIKASVNYNDIASNLSNKLKISIEYDSDELYLYSLKTVPSLVEFIIEK